ncbi:ABC-three component system protein [Mesorhizobium sp. M0239]|uniref:ABC-three component system protein n=1 Tax=Mesorhizobium sp. M0239 TaxID=2956924 RepID=UPI003334FD1E
MTITTTVDQSGASAERDLAGRDIHNTYNYPVLNRVSAVEKLLQRLQVEMEQNLTVRDTIDRLQRFYSQRSHDGINGLKAKLEVSGRESSYFAALEMKEMFVKLLERWSLYASAQQIMAHLLARAERQFNDIILPQISNCDEAQINKITNELIISPTVDDCGASVFEIDHNTAMGMVYWLAEQCFIRWHK